MSSSSELGGARGDKQEEEAKNGRRKGSNGSNEALHDDRERMKSRSGMNAKRVEKEEEGKKDAEWRKMKLKMPQSSNH